MRPNPNVSRHRPVVHGGLFSIPGLSSDVLDFSSNINPLGMSPKVKQAIRKNLDLFETYPDPKSQHLRDTLESYTGVPSSYIMVGNGATELIYNFCLAFLSYSTPVLIAIPTFEEYETAARLAGANPSFFCTMNLQDDLEMFLSRIPSNGYVFVCNPNNPTGTLVSKKEMEKIIRHAKKRGTTVFVDESFMDLVIHRGESVMRLVQKHRNLIVLHSLTKSFALAGMRLGYCVGPRHVISTLDRIKMPWNVSGMAQKAVPAALSDLAHLDNAKRIIRAETEFLKREISKIDGFKCRDTSANFILIKTSMDSTMLQKKLLKRKILVRDCKSFRGLDSSYIRIAVKTRRENKKLIEALESWDR